MRAACSVLSAARLSNGSRLIVRSIPKTCCIYPVSTSSFATQFSRCLSSTRNQRDEKEKKWKWPFHLTMTSEQKEVKQQRIEEMKQEEVPTTLFAKVKYYFKRYWYIAVPAHMVSCTGWFITFYALVHSGVDVIALLQALHVPDLLVEKIKNTPPSAGVFVIALLLYKIATPIRYMTTLVLIQASFWGLRRFGKLRTVREVEYKVRSQYEHNKQYYGRRLYRYRNLGVRDIERKHTHDVEARRRSADSGKSKKSDD